MHLPEVGVVVRAAAVVADGGLDRLGDDREVVDQQFVQRLVGQFRGLFQGLVQVGDVRLVVLAVMDFHRLLVDVRLEGIGRIRQRGKGVGHGFSPSGL